jgi:general secretion pathway protein G
MSVAQDTFFDIAKKMLEMRKGRALCLSTAIFVVVMANICAWVFTGSIYLGMDYRFHRTAWAIVAISSCIEDYAETNGHFPASLSDVPDIKRMALICDIGEDQLICDDWGWPLHYEMKKGAFVLCSFGREGRPGGEGLDADICSDNLRALYFTPFWQFVFDLPTTPVKAISLIVGIATCLICNTNAGGLPETPALSIRVVWIHGLIAFIAIIAAVIINVLWLIMVNAH